MITTPDRNSNSVESFSTSISRKACGVVSFLLAANLCFFSTRTFAQDPPAPNMPAQHQHVHSSPSSSEMEYPRLGRDQENTKEPTLHSRSRSANR